MSLPFSDAFRGRRVLVTGHTGFKGSWLTLWLHELGAKVTGYALDPPTTPSNFEVSGVHSLLERHAVADIRDRAALGEAFAVSDPEIVFHLAAQALVREGYRQPLETFEINTLGTANVLEAVRERARPCVVVVVTSDKCYESREQVWGYRECDPLGGNDPYSASKGAAELVTAAYRRSYFDPRQLARHGVRVASARAGNVIGGGDWAADRIVPDLVRALSAGRPVPIRHPDAVRPWQHVLEPTSGYLTLAARMVASDDADLCTAWNFGPLPEQAVTVAELAEMFIEAWGGGAWVDSRRDGEPHETRTLHLSIEKAVRELQWHPRWSAVVAARRTANWYRRQAASNGALMRDACLEDIAAYLSPSPRTEKLEDGRGQEA